jgi:hypothetical protein
VSRDEKKYLPALAPSASGDAGESLTRLLKALRTGGGVAEHAVPKLVGHADPKTSASVAKVMLKPTSGPDVRRYAANVLGGRKAADQIRALGRALLIEVDADALLAMLDALEAIGDAAAGDAVLQFLKKRQAYFARRTQGSQVHHSDWATILPTLAKACALAGTFKPAKGGDVVADTILKGVLLADVAVVYDRQNQRPRPALQALARAACDALGRLGGGEAVAALERVVKAGEGVGDVTIKVLRGPVVAMSDFARDPVVSAAAAEALAALKQ